MTNTDAEAEPMARTAPETCSCCYNEDDCASIDICRAVEQVYATPAAPPDPLNRENELTCLFCGTSVEPGEGVTDINGEVACKECGEAELHAQAEERAEGGAT